MKFAIVDSRDGDTVSYHESPEAVGTDLHYYQLQEPDLYEYLIVVTYPEEPDEGEKKSIPASEF